MRRVVGSVAGKTQSRPVFPQRHVTICPSAVEMLVKEGVEFGCFDILADQSVRNDLKKFSEWPTYPQLVRPMLFPPTAALFIASHLIPQHFGCVNHVNISLYAAVREWPARWRP